MPGGTMAGVVVDANRDGKPDGIDFDGDGKRDIGLVMINDANAVGVSEQINGKIDFYLIRNSGGEISAATSLQSSAITLSSSSGRKYSFWTHLRLGAAGNFSLTPVPIFDKKMSAWGASLFFIKGLDNFWLFRKLNKGKRISLVPGLRTEIQYLTFEIPALAFRGLSALVGPQWLLPEMGGHRGRFILAVEAGVFAFVMSGLNINEKTATPIAQAVAGYEYPFGNVDISINIRSGMIFDQSSPLLTYGAEMGVSYGF